MSGGEVSVTAVVGPKTVPALPKQQPPIVSMFPVSKISQGGPPILQPEVQVKGMILFLAPLPGPVRVIQYSIPYKAVLRLHGSLSTRFSK